MTQNFHIHDITPETSNWTCKVQIVDICGPGESKDKRIKYFNMIAQDERQDRVKLIVYGDNIPAYQKRMKLYHTYRITGGYLQPPYLKNEKSVHTFNWVLDKRNIIDAIEKDDVDALPLPTKPYVASFQDIKDHLLQPAKTDTNINEFDILAIVVNCSPPRYVASVEKRIQELLVTDMSKQTLTFTIWEEGIMEHEGKKLLHLFHRYPVILARRVGASKYNGVSLTTKFNTTIQIDSPYPQCRQLQKWVTENEEILTLLTRNSTSKSGFLIPIPMDEQVVPIAKIDSQPDVLSFINKFTMITLILIILLKTFSIEAKISFSTDLSNLYVLVCSNCGQDVRYPTIREIDRMNCDQKTTLIPKCKFEIQLQDNSGSTIGLIMDKEAEKLVSLTAEELYRKASAPDKCATMKDIQAYFNKKLFSVQAKKAFARTSRATPIKLYIQSCMEKQSSTHYLPSPNTIKEGSKRKQQIGSPELTQQTESLKMKQKLQSDTPQKQK